MNEFGAPMQWWWQEGNRSTPPPRPKKHIPVPLRLQKLQNGLSSGQWLNPGLRDERPATSRLFFFCVLLFSIGTSSVLVSLSWLSSILTFVFTTQHTQHKYPCPLRDSFSFALSSFFISTSLSWLVPFVLYYTMQHKHPWRGRIRTRNPSKRAVADSRLRPLGHWDQHHLSNCTVWWWYDDDDDKDHWWKYRLLNYFLVNISKHTHF